MTFRACADGSSSEHCCLVCLAPSHRWWVMNETAYGYCHSHAPEVVFGRRVGPVSLRELLCLEVLES